MIPSWLKDIGLFLLGLLLAVEVAFGVGKGKGRREERQEADLANAKRDAAQAETVRDAVVKAGEERRETDHQVQEMKDDAVREELRRDWTRR